MNPQDLSALVGSRICHDLISPLGAIGNGIELLTLTGVAQSPEMALISESIENANARIRLFRVAFGSPGSGQSIGANEVASILKAISRGGRVQHSLSIEGDPDRAEVQCVFLAILCMEASMPAGGTISVTKDGDIWTLRSETETLRQDGDLWNSLMDPESNYKVSSAQVQFALLPRALTALGRSMNISADDTGLSLTF
ncbi:histidine phosphotransferase family protein [Aestuariibius sp. HNIBRBA575]|uniref:histidine phosphotransferase family protein n=1 Tax=Aestuariibius sp. HNIBRBA575 TaxID=3233343 RepID=UPI0034A3FB0A